MSAVSPIQDVETKFFKFGSAAEPFRLRGGGALEQVTVAYETYGTLNADGSNAILLFHALSGSQHACGFNAAVPGVGARWNRACQSGWWEAFIGPGKALNTGKFFVICANYLGGCYGSTGPSSPNPATSGCSARVASRASRSACLRSNGRSCPGASHCTSANNS